MKKLKIELRKPLNSSKPKLLIFGDSFADPTYNPTEAFLAYYYRLEKYFTVENFESCGSGPEWSLQQFLKFDNSTPYDNKKNIRILFIASHWSRFNFSFYTHPSDQIYGLKYFTLASKYEKYKNFINGFLKHYVSKNDHFVLQNMLLVTL